MVGEKERVDAYQATIARFEPDIAMTDQDAALTSIAISMKRIADAMENNQPDWWAFADKLQSSIESGMFYGSQKK